MNVYDRKVSMSAVVLISLILFSSTVLFAENIKIAVSPEKLVGTINPLIFGHSMIGYDRAHFEPGAAGFVGYSNYGAGVWDPYTGRPVAHVIGLAKDAGMTIARFPGGSGSIFYNWKETIGSPEKRPQFLYGLDEFLITTEEIGCEAVFTLPYVTGSPEDAADLVEYLNAPNDKSNPGGGIDWAEIRSKNGHPKPYGVKYFELGNEVNFGVPIKQIPGADPVNYGKDYIEYRTKMKAVDPSIMLGAVTVNSSWSKGLSPWNDEMFKTAGRSIDFLIDHTYSLKYSSNNNDVNLKELFSQIFKSLDKIEPNYRDLSEHFQKVTGRIGIPVAITEYNTGFHQESPVPLRHSLGAALYNAGLLQIFMKPEHNIFMANYWQFVNSYWGTIKNNDYMKRKGTYIKRPNYYVFEMFHKHFGDDLVDIRVSDGNNINGVEEKDLLSGIKWTTKMFSGADIDVDDDKVQITFNGESDLNFHQVFKRVAVKPNTIYRFSGLLRADNLQDHEGVGLEIQDGRGWAKTYSQESTERVWGTTEWVNVESYYTTLSDASEISIMVRRKSGGGLIKGKAYVKEVKLIEGLGTGLKGAEALSVSGSKSKDGKKMYIMVLNKNVYEDVKVDIETGDSNLSSEINVWTLNGPSVQSVNETYPDTVAIRHEKVKLSNSRKFRHSFPAHSLSSIEFTVK